MDSIDLNTLEQNSNVLNAANIDSQIVGLVSNIKSVDYSFPEFVFTPDEACTMMYMLSHNFVNHDPIQEQGVITFHENPSEAIAPTKVLAGIIAGMTDSPITSGKLISGKLTGVTIQTEVDLKDAILAVTFGNLMGIASFYEFQNNKPSYDSKLIYGVKGSWINGTYTLDGTANSFQMLRNSNRATLGQIRGALDGYIIGTHLKRNMATKGVKLTLSSILGLYYSSPQIGAFMDKLGVNYCDRADQMPNKVELSQVGTAYNQIFNYIYSKEGSLYKGDLMYEALYNGATNVQGMIQYNLG